jgi:hypothetical protein
MNDQMTIKHMDTAQMWVLVSQNVMIAFCLNIAAWKCFSCRVPDWHPVAVWGLAVASLALSVTQLLYPVFTILSTNNPTYIVRVTLGFKIAG